MNGLPIRLRLTLWYAGSLTLLVALFAFSIDGLMHRRLLARTDFELDEELHELQLEVELARTRDNMLRQLNLRFGQHETFDFVLQTPDGEPVFASHRIVNVEEALAPTRAGAADGFARATLAGLGECRIGSRPAKGPEGELSIAVVVPLARYLAELRDLRQLLAIIGPLVVLTSVAGGYVIARRAIQPVDAMRAAAERITAEQLGERLAAPNPDDELGRLAATLNAMIHRLQRALDEMRQFTADAAHELRTPLAVIRSAAEVALRRARSPQQYEECLQTVVEEVERLTAVSNQLLLLAREDAGLSNEAFVPLDLGELVAQSLGDLEPLAEQKGLSVSVRGSDPLPVVGDPQRLRRVFTNLVENAVKYTPDGGAIHITLERTADRAEVTIRDTGIGIPAEHLPFVFDRFYRVEPSHNQESGGTGLGLAICRAIVTSHQGTIVIRSEVGQGTELRLSLPANRVTPSNDSEAATSRPLEFADDAGLRATRPAGAHAG